jgi:hypothetical protein
MLEGSATVTETVKMMINAGRRRRIFRLLMMIALVGRFFEAPLSAEGGALNQQQSSGQDFCFFRAT